MSDDTKNATPPFFGKRLNFLNDNYFWIGAIVIGSFALGAMENYIGIGGALGTGVGYGFMQRNKRGFTRGFLVGASMVLIAICWARYL